MYLIECTESAETIIKKSRFIAKIQPIQAENEVNIAIKDEFNTHPNANHIAFSFRIQTAQGIRYRYYDAGEPSGTAGKPIYQQIEGNDLINVLITVTRYFGGIKLGAGGLTRAYGKAAKLTIEKSQLITYVEYERVKIELEYSALRQFEYQMEKLGARIQDQQFGEKITISADVPKDKLEQLAELTLFNPSSPC